MFRDVSVVAAFLGIFLKIREYQIIKISSFHENQRWAKSSWRYELIPSVGVQPESRRLPGTETIPATRWLLRFRLCLFARSVSSQETRCFRIVRPGSQSRPPCRSTKESATSAPLTAKHGESWGRVCNRNPRTSQ